MVTLRHALVDKFGFVPVIDMYRQASIRCQKAKRWEAASEWAQRGLDVYGEHAARPEVVDDLLKRLAHAAAKIEAASQPKKRKPRPVAVSTSADQLEIETFVCSSCGESFHRERTRGRKPKVCPTCRGSTTSVVSG
jgi:formylmethanofuran dehydrogenase subunit E